MSTKDKLKAMKAAEEKNAKRAAAHELLDQFADKAFAAIDNTARTYGLQRADLIKMLNDKLSARDYMKARGEQENVSNG